MNKWVLAFISLSISACATDSNRSISYYHFDIAKSAAVEHTAFDKPRLEVIPVSMPEHLNARGIAQRINKHKTVNANWHLWSSQPASMLDHSALNQLEKSLPQWFVVGAGEPWLADNQKSPQKIVKLQFTLERFNGGLQSNAELIGSWTAFDQNDQLLLRQNFSESVPLDTDGYEGLAAALQQAGKTFASPSQIGLTASDANRMVACFAPRDGVKFLGSVCIDKSAFASILIDKTITLPTFTNI